MAGALPFSGSRRWKYKVGRYEAPPLPAALDDRGQRRVRSPCSLNFRSCYVHKRHDVLKQAIAFALRHARKIVRGLKDGLSEEERYAVADHVVRQLKESGASWAVRRRSNYRRLTWRRSGDPSPFLLSVNKLIPNPRLQRKRENLPRKRKIRRCNPRQHLQEIRPCQVAIRLEAMLHVKHSRNSLMGDGGSQDQ